MLKYSNKIFKSTLVAEEPNFQHPALNVRSWLKGVLSQHCAVPDQGGFCHPGHSFALTLLYWLDPGGTYLSVWASSYCCLSHIWTITFYIKSKSHISSLKEALQLGLFSFCSHLCPLACGPVFLLH